MRVYLCSFPNLRLSWLPCVGSDMVLATKTDLGLGVVCPHSRAHPPSPRQQGFWCVSSFFLLVYTLDSVYVRCVACEFPANVECFLLAAVASQLGLARRVGRGP